MYVCMYVCMYVRMYVCMYVYGFVSSHQVKQGSQGSEVDIVKSYGGIWLSNPVWDKRIFSSYRPDWPWGLPGLLFSSYQSSFPGVKRPGCDVDHSPSFSVEVTNEWSQMLHQFITSNTIKS
jgi:hypothetical protein